MPAASKKAFTLVELLIVVTIMAVLMAGTYIPYARFSLAAKVREGAEKSAQAASAARALCLNGYLLGKASGSGVTSDVALRLNSASGSLETWALPWDSGTGASSANFASGTLVSRYDLPSGTRFLKVSAGSLSGSDALLYWDAPLAKFSASVDGAPAVSGTGVSLSVGAPGETVDGTFRKTITLPK